MFSQVECKSSRHEIGLVDRTSASEDTKSEQKNSTQNQEDDASRPIAVASELKSGTHEEKAHSAQQTSFEKDPAVAGWRVIRNAFSWAHGLFC
jgi:hypothetical protein